MSDRVQIGEHQPRIGRPAVLSPVDHDGTDAATRHPPGSSAATVDAQRTPPDTAPRPARPPAVEGAVHRFELAPESVLRFLLVAIAALVIASTLGQLAVYRLPHFPLRDGVAYMFYLNHEQSIPTMFSVLLLLACAAVVSLIAVTVRRRRLAYPWHWAVIAALFVLLAVDEQLELHERAIEPVRDRLGTGGILYLAWVIPGTILVAGLAAVFVRFVLALPRRVRSLTVAAAACFVGGAIGMEMASGWYQERHTDVTLGYVPFPTIEEALEMTGAAVFLYAMLCYTRDHLGGLAVDLRTTPPRPAREPAARTREARP